MRNSFIRKEQGTISLEACIVMPAFIFLMLLVYGLIILFLGRYEITHAMVQTSRSLSLDPLSVCQIAEGAGGTGKDETTAIIDEFCGGSDSSFAGHTAWYSDGADPSVLQEECRERFLSYLGDDEKRADRMLRLFGVEDGAQGLDFSECRISDGNIVLTVRFDQKFIYDFNGLASFSQTMTQTSRLWQNSEG